MSLSPHSQSLDPFQQFFEPKDHLEQMEIGDDTTVISPYEVSVLHSVLATATAPEVPLTWIYNHLVFYLADVEDGEVADVSRLRALIEVVSKVQKAQGLGSDDLLHIRCADTIDEIVKSPERYFSHCSIEVSPSATPETVSFLVANQNITTQSHISLCRLLLDLDVQKDGVIEIDVAYREVYRELSLTSVTDRKRLTKMILSCANMNELGQVSLSDFIELYAMSVYVIPQKYLPRAGGSAALSKTFDLSDYSLLWASLAAVENVPVAHLRGALADCIAVEGVVSDECSLEALVDAVLAYVGEDDVERKLGELMDLLVAEPTRFSIPMMAVEDMQSVIIRKLRLYCNNEVLVGILHVFLLDDARGAGCVAKTHLETALATVLTQSTPRARTPTLNEGSPFSGDLASEPAGSLRDSAHLEELLRSVVLCLPYVEGKGILQISGFVDLLLAEFPVTTSQLVCDFVVPFDVNVPLPQVEHFLCNERCAHMTREEFRGIISNSLRLVNEDVMDAVCSAVVACSLDPVDGIYDFAPALQIAVPRTNSIVIPVRKLPPYQSNVVCKRLQLSAPDVRRVASLFVALDTDFCGVLDFDKMSRSLLHQCNGDLKGARDRFRCLDMDGDGRVGFSEFIASYNRGYYGPAVIEVPPSNCVQQVEVPNQVAFTRPTLGANDVTPRTRPLPRDTSLTPVVDSHLREEFLKFDTTRNGFLDRKEFAELYRNMENFGVQPTRRAIDALFASVCGNDNRVSYEEFCVLMLRRSRM